MRKIYNVKSLYANTGYSINCTNLKNIWVDGIILILGGCLRPVFGFFTRYSSAHAHWGSCPIVLYFYSFLSSTLMNIFFSFNTCTCWDDKWIPRFFGGLCVFAIHKINCNCNIFFNKRVRGFVNPKREVTFGSHQYTNFN